MHNEYEGRSFTSLTPLQRGLGSSSDRKHWLRACENFHRVMRASSLFAYPAQFDAAKKLLAEAGHPIDAGTDDLVCKQMLEAPRAQLRERLIFEARERFDKEVLPRVHDLWPRVLERLQGAITKLEEVERSTAQKWGIPFSESVTLQSLKATHRHHTEHPPVAAYSGDDIEAQLGVWFEDGSLK